MAYQTFKKIIFIARAVAVFWTVSDAEVTWLSKGYAHYEN